MCITLSLKFSEELGQNKHCPGVNGCMAVLEDSVNPSKDVGVEPVSGLDGRLIVVVEAVAVVVVVVVVVTIITDGLEAVAVLI